MHYTLALVITAFIVLPPSTTVNSAPIVFGPENYFDRISPFPFQRSQAFGRQDRLPDLYYLEQNIESSNQRQREQQTISASIARASLSSKAVDGILHWNNFNGRERNIAEPAIVSSRTESASANRQREKLSDMLLRLALELEMRKVSNTILMNGAATGASNTAERGTSLHFF